MGVEAEQLHLDEAAGVELELPRCERPVLDGDRNRGLLDDDPLVTLDERVDDQLIGPGLELEMLEGIDV